MPLLQAVEPMKREKRLTKRERKAQNPRGPGALAPNPNQHIHCISCGRHLDAAEFQAPASAKLIRCQHGSTFPACVTCEASAVALIAEHDRTRQPVQRAGAWH
jgi:hypothetical protein